MTLALTRTPVNTPCTQTCTTRFRGNPSLRSAEHVPQRRDTTSVKIEVPGRGDPPPAVEGGRPKPKRLRTWVTAGDSGLNMHAIAVVTVSGPSEANFTPTSRQHRHPSDYKQETSVLLQHNTSRWTPPLRRLSLPRQLHSRGACTMLRDKAISRSSSRPCQLGCRPI